MKRSDGLSVFFARLCFCQADVRNLRIRKRTPGDHVREAFCASYQQRIACRLKRLPAREVRELIATGAVACGVDMLHARLEMLVDRYASLTEGHARFFQVQTRDIGSAANCDEQEIGRIALSSDR